VTAFTTGKDSLQTFRERPNKFDLIIMNMMMPKINGLDPSREFINIRQDIPIVLCTGFSERVDRDTAKKRVFVN